MDAGAGRGVTRVVIWDFGFGVKGGGGLSVGFEKRREVMLVVVRVDFHKLSLGFVCSVSRELS